jgi:hypothetical protein
MMEPRKREHHAKVRKENAYHGAAHTKHGAGVATAAGRTAYREEFERNYGPDLDEPLDGTESGHEF